jgi:DNA-binding beta-propeller fold protein YncE
VTNARSNTITVYDREGRQVKTEGSFPDVNFPEAITYDEVDHLLYVTMESTAGSSVVVYDTEGNELAGCGFPITGGIGLAFDPYHRQLYVADNGVLPGPGTVRVYDQAGKVIRTSGTFFVLINPVAVALDAHNGRLYVLEIDGTGPHLGGLIEVFDLVGNSIITSGSFPQLSVPAAIAFDSSNDRFYVPNSALGGMTVYDEEGDLVDQFPLLIGDSGGGPSAITFDDSNNLLYLAGSNDTVTAYDQDGRVSPTKGGFPNLNDPSGIVAVP